MVKYMAPEMFHIHRGPAVDIYSLRISTLNISIQSQLGTLCACQLTECMIVDSFDGPTQALMDK